VSDVSEAARATDVTLLMEYAAVDGAPVAIAVTTDGSVLFAEVPLAAPRAARLPRLVPRSAMAELRLPASTFSDWISVCLLVSAVTGKFAIEDARVRMV